MFDGDLLLSYTFMALLFLRQISILKQPNKLNYAPLIIGIGIISAILHLITSPDMSDSFLILKESLIPVVASLFLYIVMNILHQTAKTQEAKNQNEITKVLIEQIEELKEFTGELEKKVILSQNKERQTQEETRERFKHDVKVLDSILINQNKFLEKFEQLEEWHDDVKNSFENFTKVQLPSLDNVVHKHIDILRVAEQDHFNKVKATLTRAVESRSEIIDEIEELKDSLKAMSNMSQTISNTIINHTLDGLSKVVNPFEKEIVSLRSHTEGVNTSLYESENRLEGIKEQSELIMKQMVLSSNKMSELQSQNSSLYDTFITMRDLMKDIEAIKSEYVKSQSQLSMIIKELKDAKESDIEDIKEQMESLIVALSIKVDNSLEKLYKHYHIASEDISQSVKFLSKKAQFKHGYSDLNKG